MKRVVAILMMMALTGCAAHRQFKPEPIVYDPFTPSENNALAAMADYEFGDNREPLMVIQDMIREGQDSPGRTALLAHTFGDMLSSDATLASKQFMCRQLHVIGERENVPQIAPLLTDHETADMARYALEQIDSKDVGIALLEALKVADDSIKVGIINSLARTGTSRAINPLKRLATDPNAQVAQAAISALEKIDR